jgi:long-subunit acyl-CoA synthetase (AMP-forming)
VDNDNSNDKDKDQQNILRRKKKQIHGRGSNADHSIFNEEDRKERASMIECSRTKMKLDEARHRDMREIKEKKIEEENKREEKMMLLNKLRFELDSKTVELNNRKVEMELEQDVILQAQEKKKLLLLNLEVFKARQAMKKEDPTLTDD